MPLPRPVMIAGVTACVALLAATYYAVDRRRAAPPDPSNCAADSKLVAGAPLAPGLTRAPLTAEGGTYTVVTVDLGRADLRLFWKRADGTRLGSFETLADHLARTGGRLAFATNAGIFDPRYTPVGLHVEEGREFVPLNLADGDGNFYLKPNGVFLVDAAGARVIDATTYPGTTPAVRLATQSGPLLLLDGKVHPKFMPQSTNRRVRSGVGVSSPRSVHFVLSQQPVTFHELALVFRDQLNCRDALYLDGVISRFHPPAAGEQRSGSGEFAGMLGITAGP